MPLIQPDKEPDMQHDHAEKVACRSWQLLLGYSDQAVIVCFLCVGLIGLLSWTVRMNSGPGGTIELDRAIERQASFQIDMNRADWAEWAAIPDIGERIARRIITSRENQGPFASPIELMRVKGIGPKTLEQIRPYLLPDPEMQNVVKAP